MSGVKKVFQGMGALGQVVCDMGTCIAVQSQLAHTFCMVFFFQKTSMFVLKLEKFHVTFLFLCVLLSIQRTGYSRKVKKKKKTKFNKGEQC